MIKRTEIFLKQLVLLIDVTVLVLAFVSSHRLREALRAAYHWDLFPGKQVLEQIGSLQSYLWLLLLILPLWLGTLSLLGGYQKLRTRSYLWMTWTLLKAGLLSLFAFGSLVFLLKLHYVSRTFMATFFLVSFASLAVERAILKVCFRLMLLRGYFHRNLVIVGTGRRARHFIQTVQAHRHWGLRIVGLLDEDTRLAGQRVEGAEVVGSLAQLPRILREWVVDEVLFVVPRNWMSRIEPAILKCEVAGVRATIAVDFFNMRFAKAHPSDLEGIPLISFETTPADEWRLAVKRVTDFCVAAAALLLLSPVMLAVAALVKLTSPGPVFFRQTRIGLNGRRFTLYKFRSMVADAEAQREGLQHLNEMSGPVFKITNDPRMTPLGRLLRKTSLDELPQLLNVLRGEMSLVGPRPLVVREVERFEAWQRRRLSMRPGITGYWQVNGRNEIKDFNRWMELDLEYIDRWSLRLDTEILLKTLPAVVFGKGAK